MEKNCYQITKKKESSHVQNLDLTEVNRKLALKILEWREEGNLKCTGKTCQGCLEYDHKLTEEASQIVNKADLNNRLNYYKENLILVVRQLLYNLENTAWILFGYNDDDIKIKDMSQSAFKKGWVILIETESHVIYTDYTRIESGDLRLSLKYKH